MECTEDSAMRKIHNIVHIKKKKDLKINNPTSPLVKQSKNNKLTFFKKRRKNRNM